MSTPPPPQPAAGSAALMTTTSMTPQSTSSLHPPPPSTGPADVQIALEQYGALRDQYVQMINTALREQDSEKRAGMMPQISAANQQLVALVNQIQEVYNQGQSALSAQPTGDLQAALDKYKQQLEELRTDEDELVRLNRLYKDIDTQNHAVIPQATYYGWILLVLVLLFVVFALFVGTAFRGYGESILPSIPSLDLGLATPSPMVL